MDPSNRSAPIMHGVRHLQISAALQDFHGATVECTQSPAIPHEVLPSDPPAAAPITALSLQCQRHKRRKQHKQQEHVTTDDLQLWLQQCGAEQIHTVTVDIVTTTT